MLVNVTEHDIGGREWQEREMGLMGRFEEMANMSSEWDEWEAI